MTRAPAVHAATSSEVATSKEGGDDLGLLMVGYQGGDAQAFRALFDRIRGPLRGYVLSLVRDRGRADDLVQETLLQLHRSRHTYLPPRPVLPWVLGIARHVVLMDRRAAGRRSKLLDEHIELPTELPMPTGDLDLSDRDALRRALGRVSEDQREVVLLHHFWGFSFAEIGQILGIRAGAAKVRSHRGIARLRTLLGVKGDG